MAKQPQAERSRAEGVTATCPAPDAGDGAERLERTGPPRGESGRSWGGHGLNATWLTASEHARQFTAVSLYEEASSPQTPVPHGGWPLAISSLGSAALCSATPSPEPLWRRNYCVKGRSFQGNVVVGLTRRRAVGGTSGPLFRQLPFPGVSPQPLQLPLSVTRRLGESRRDWGRGSVSCRWGSGVCISLLLSIRGHGVGLGPRGDWLKSGSVTARGCEEELRGCCDPGAVTARGLWPRCSCLRGVCDPGAVNARGLWPGRARGRGCERTVTEKVGGSASEETQGRGRVTVRGLREHEAAAGGIFDQRAVNFEGLTWTTVWAQWPDMALQGYVWARGVVERSWLGREGLSCKEHWSGWDLSDRPEFNFMDGRLVAGKHTSRPRSSFFISEWEVWTRLMLSGLWVPSCYWVVKSI